MASEQTFEQASGKELFGDPQFHPDRQGQGAFKGPSLRIGDVAEEVGFLDMAHFSRVFKKIEGISANEYRNKI